MQLSQNGLAAHWWEVEEYCAITVCCPSPCPLAPEPYTRLVGLHEALLTGVWGGIRCAPFFIQPARLDQVPERRFSTTAPHPLHSDIARKLSMELDEDKIRAEFDRRTEDGTVVFNRNYQTTTLVDNGFRVRCYWTLLNR